VSTIKNVELKLISELIKNSRTSDRTLAKAIGASQPTVSRLRSKLEKKVINEYTMRPNLVELGFELLVVTFGMLNYKKQADPRLGKKIKDFVKKRPNIIFASTGKGMHSDRLSISIHRNYSDYSKYMQELTTEYGEFYTTTDSFLISLTNDKILRPMTLRPIANHLKDEKKMKRARRK